MDFFGTYNLFFEVRSYFKTSRVNNRILSGYPFSIPSIYQNNVVVFPAPLGPIIPRISASFTLNETLSTERREE